MCEFGACTDIGFGLQDSISAFQNSELTCALQGAVAGVEDLTGISMLPGANQDNWKWYYASPSSFGFIYTGAGEGASVSAVDAAGRAGDYVKDNPWAQNWIRGYLRNQGLKISNARIARYAGRIGKYAGWYGKLTAAKSAYDRYTKCRAF